MEYVFIDSACLLRVAVSYHSLVCRCICDCMTFLLPQTDLTDVDMEDDMKHIVSDEIRRFRQSYKVSPRIFSHPCFNLHHITIFYQSV